MFVDEIIIKAKAGKGGDGVVRWRREHGRPWGGPAGGNGGRGGSVFVRAIRDNNVLSKYTGEKLFAAQNGGDGQSKSQYGKHGEDLLIDVPLGSVVTHLGTQRKVELFEEGETVCILKGGTGGLGNEYFKSSTNRAPEEHTKGKQGEEGEFRIEVELVVDVGIIGFPNAGKSSLLNALTRAQSRVGEYPFTTLSPHLGDLFGFILADIPGLIEGASEGKGLGQTFLRHVKRTRMLLHCVSLENEDPLVAYQAIRKELVAYDSVLGEKEEWVILTKTDLVSGEQALAIRSRFEKEGKRVYLVSIADAVSLKVVTDNLLRRLREHRAA